MSSKTNDVLAKVIVAIFLVPAVFAIWTWLYMLLLGAVHTFIPIIPALGFWQTVIFGLFLAMTGGALKNSPVITVSKSN